MRRGTAVLVLAILAGSVGLAVLLYGNRQNDSPPPIKTEDRIPRLKELVANQEKESTQAVAAYRPKTPARIDDLDISVLDLLRHLPGVAEVEVGVKAEKPACRIVHLRDWHFVPKDLFAIDMKNAHGRELSTEEIDRLYQEHQLEVEAVQLEEMALLRCLIKHHGLKRLYFEGLTAIDFPNYMEKIAVLKDMEYSQISDLRKELVKVRETIKAMDPNSGRHAEAKKIEAEISDMIEQHDLRLLEIGAPGRLLIAGEIDEVLPLDDAELLDRAKPVTPEGKVRLDPVKLKARQDAQVNAVMGKGSFGLIVLGGSHDLSESVQRLGQGKCEYIRVTTKRFKEFNE
jgi:hypothetical protein